MQIKRIHGKYVVVSHGISDFDTASIVDGVVVQPDSLAKTLQRLLKPKGKGGVTTRRAAFTVPSTRCFIRSMTVPSAATGDLLAAVQLEAEQYISVPVNELYIDYNVIRRTNDEVELLLTAVPKKIVDSYLAVAALAGLEAVAIEPTITANARLFARLEKTDMPTVLIDFGAVSSDVMVFDQTLITASMVAGGGEVSTELLMKGLGVAAKEADIIKTKYGLSKWASQDETVEALRPLLNQLVQEIRRILRYYSDRVDNTKQIEQVVIMGGGANMPGLNDYLTNALRLPTRMCTPWQEIDFGSQKVNSMTEKYLYATVMGVAVIEPKELFV